MKTAAGPSPVQVVVRSVPHIVSTVSGMMVPSCVRGPRGDPTRVGAKNSFCAHQPEHAPQRGAGPGMRATGPRLTMPRHETGWRPARRGSPRATRHPTSARRSGTPGWCRAAASGGDKRPSGQARQTRHTVANPYRRPLTGETASLMACASVGPKGGRPPEAIFSFNRSRSISAAPRFAFSRSLSSSSPFAGFVLRPLRRRPERLAPAGQGRRRHAQTARNRFQILATQQSQHRCRLALPRHPAPAPERRCANSCGRSASPGRASIVRLIVHGSPLVRKSSACEVSQSTVLRGSSKFWSALSSLLSVLRFLYTPPLKRQSELPHNAASERLVLMET